MTGRVTALVRPALAGLFVALAVLLGLIPTAVAATTDRSADPANGAGPRWAAESDSPIVDDVRAGPAEIEDTGPGRVRTRILASDTVTITLRSLAPPVIGTASTLTVSGNVQAVGAGVVAPTIRLVRPRAVSLTTRSDVQAWASGATAPGSSLLLARASLPATLSPGGSAPFTLTASADGLRLARSYGALPLAVEVLDSGGAVLQSVHTFVGWSAPGSGSTPRVSIGWVAPVTLAADPALFGTDADARATAWTDELGSAGRLTRLVQGTAAAKVAWAVDPAVIGSLAPAAGAAAPEGSTAEDVATALRARFLATLVAGAPGRTVLALPYADPDLAAATSADVVPGLVAERLTQGPDLAGILPTNVVGRVAWPADGRFGDDRETAWRTAYRGGLAAVLASAEATGGDVSPTPGTAAVGRRGTPVLRYDDTLSDIAGDAGSGLTTTLSLQNFVAETAALVAERPSAARSVLVMLPRGIDADPTLLAQFLTAAQGVPWVATADVADELAAAVGSTTTIDPRPGTAIEEDPVLNAGLVDALAGQAATLRTIAGTIVDSGAFVGHWQDVIAQLTSTRWRGEAAANGTLLNQLIAATSAVNQGLTITAQTTNFLADEGVLRVTVVNDLDQTVDGIRLVLVPDNARIRILEPPVPVRIERHSKATVQVRVAAVAAGLVPVSAWLTTADGTRLGQPTELTVRANPPGAWMYFVGIGVAALVVVAGLVRGLRRPGRLTPGGEDVDVIAPTPERPLTEAVDRGRSRPSAEP